ncbi:MAG: hypothetical protein ABR975_16175 [Vulcanimicrobiaceae bacterium]
MDDRARVARLAVVLVAIATAALFASFVCQSGVPALRHDWSWPPDRALAWPWLRDSSAGWTSSGLGAARAYPTDYLIDVAIAAAIACFGAAAGLFVIAWAAAALVFAAAFALVRPPLERPWVGLPAGVVAVFNPWTYDEVVAGHLLMIIAFAAMGLTVATLRDRRRAPLIEVLLAFHQLQFFVVCILVALRRLCRAEHRRMLVVLLLVVAPIAVGVVFDRHSLLQTPRLVSWEREQAVAPLDALLLRGYYTGYARPTEPWSMLGIALTLALAALGAWRARREPAARLAVTAIVLVVAFAGALLSPFAEIVGRAYALVPALSLYRETYDVVGLVLLAYLVLWQTLAASRVAMLIGGLAAACSLIGWVVAPPAHWWVAAATIPRPVADVPAGARVAFLPAFQPLAFDGRGSGADPDARIFPSGGTALNEYLPSYPVNAALARAASTGRTDALAALSVTALVCRPWLATVQFSVSRVVGAPTEVPCRSQRLAGAPELALVPGTPPTVSVGARLGAHAVLFSDLGVGPALVDPSQSWIDASFAFAAEPELAQAYGGVYTQSDLPLAVPPAARAALVGVAAGSLLDDRDRVIARAGALAWREVDGARELRCHGACVVAALADGLPHDPAERPVSQGQAVAFFHPLSWLVEARVPAHTETAVLVWNEGYDPHWALYGTSARHVRTDGVVNGWILPGDPTERRITIVHIAAALQAFLEIVALAALAAVAAVTGVRRFR